MVEQCNERDLPLAAGDGTTWTSAPANVVVTAENGDTATYTVAVTYTDLT